MFLTNFSLILNMSFGRQHKSVYEHVLSNIFLIQYYFMWTIIVQFIVKAFLLPLFSAIYGRFMI